MITIFDLSREAYIEILKEMPEVIGGKEQNYDTVTLVLTPATDIATNNLLKYVTIAHGTNHMSIDFKHFHYISIS